VEKIAVGVVGKRRVLALGIGHLGQQIERAVLAFGGIPQGIGRGDHPAHRIRDQGAHIAQRIGHADQITTEVVNYRAQPPSGDKLTSSGPWVPITSSLAPAREEGDNLGMAVHLCNVKRCVPKLVPNV